MERLNESYQVLLKTHRVLKAQNDDVIVRVALEQQYTINPVIKGKQMEEDAGRAGLGNQPFGGEQGSSREKVDLVGTSRR